MFDQFPRLTKAVYARCVAAIEVPGGYWCVYDNTKAGTLKTEGQQWPFYLVFVNQHLTIGVCTGCRHLPWGIERMTNMAKEELK